MTFSLSVSLCVEIRGPLELALSVHHVGLREPTQAVRLGRKHLPLPSELSHGPQSLMIQSKLLFCFPCSVWVEPGPQQAGQDCFPRPHTRRTSGFIFFSFPLFLCLRQGLTFSRNYTAEADLDLLVLLLCLQCWDAKPTPSGWASAGLRIDPIAAKGLIGPPSYNTNNGVLCVILSLIPLFIPFSPNPSFLLLQGSLLCIPEWL